MKAGILNKAVAGVVLIALAYAVGCVPAAWAAGRDLRDDFSQVGKVREMDYRSGEFDLEYGRESCAVIVDRAIIELATGRRGEVRDLRDGVLVRVIGQRLSDSAVRANAIEVVDGRGGLDDRRERSYRPDGKVDLDAYVVRVRASYGEMDIKARSQYYLVAIKPGAIIRRYIYVTDLSDIREGDQVKVTGVMAGGAKIDADRIQVLAASRGRTSRGYDSMSREYDICGVITFPAASFDRTFAIDTDYGERKVDVPRTAEVTRDRQPATVHDLRRGDRVRAYGTWDDATLVATRVEADSRTFDRDSGDYREPDKGSPSPEPGYRPNEQQTAPGQPHTGRIVSIDYDDYLMTIDSGLADVRVDALEAVISRKGSIRRFSDLKKGDKVEVSGDYSEGTIKAASIDILD